MEPTEYAHYLIAERNANVTAPSYREKIYGDDDPNEKFYPVSLLRDWTYGLSSEQYKIKMDIVKEFTHQGVNYRGTKINKYTLEQIKKLYPDTWEDYIQVY